jgi:hypothetical protein
MTKAMTPEAITNAVLALSGIIALNIIATIAHHITDVDKLREQAEEEAFAKVEDATLKQISKNADTLAANLAPIMAADWQTQTQTKYGSGHKVSDADCFLARLWSTMNHLVIM